MFQNLARTLLPHQALRIVCAGCGRAVNWPRAVAMRRLGADAIPADIRRKLTCSACGKRETARLTVV